ncbi:hypothetical protein HOLleu_39579 [Holothuria leucospilota]|uniref:Uncharacterized protein n=1 Tax=Holothuria leucospilota TaxID=206669 RepID=A0A9Q0YL15_HOLLE|nr:hypothetical protein HOLleu_39579 [Holothuria leucospilota]
MAIRAFNARAFGRSLVLSHRERIQASEWSVSFHFLGLLWAAFTIELAVIMYRVKNKRVAAFILLDNRRVNRRQWVHHINTRRERYGEYNHLMEDLRQDRQKLRKSSVLITAMFVSIFTSLQVDHTSIHT